MAGRYWHIGSTCGVPVYRQEAGATPHDYELVLVHIDGEASGVPKLRSMQGWFIVKGDVVEALTASQDAAQVAMCGAGPDPNVVAWCGAGPQMPTKAHVPFWTKKPHKGISVKPLVEFLECQIEELQCKVHDMKFMHEQVDAVAAKLNAVEGNLALASSTWSTKGRNCKLEDEGNLGQAGWGEGKADGSAGSEDSPPTKMQAIGLKRERQPGGGGWFNKMKVLLGYILQNDWVKATKMANEYADVEKNPKMAEELNRRMTRVR